MSNPGWALQVAIFQALNGNLTGVSGQNVPIYDGIAPQGSRYPYVILDSQAMTPDDPLASRRDMRFVYLSVWSTYRGQMEVHQILGQAYELLHEERLPMADGCRMVRIRVTRQQTSRDADEATYMGTLTLEARIEH